MNKQRHAARKARNEMLRARAKLMSPELLIQDATTRSKHNAAKKEAAIGEIAWRMMMARTNKAYHASKKYKHQLFLSYRRTVRIHAGYLSGRVPYNRQQHGYYYSHVEEWFTDNAIRERTDDMAMNGATPF